MSFWGGKAALPGQSIVPSGGSRGGAAGGGAASTDVVARGDAGQQWAGLVVTLLTETAKIGLSLYLGHRALELLRSMMAKTSEVDVAKMKRELAKRLHRPEIEVMDLNSHEARLAQDCVASENIDVSFADIGGMEEQLEVVKDNIILPMQMARMHECKGLLTCPTGALLYGRPGTGKTMIAKALAKEARATFINVKASSVMDKWLGESDKMAAAIFSLARKLSPTIVFIDEIDTLLKNRDRGAGSQSDGVASMQGVFLAEWDGLSAVAGSDKPVVVLGATNRPQDLDKAFLRRMPVMIQVPPPNLRGRVDILRRQLARETLGEDVVLEEVALLADDYTGSDLRELVRTASLRRAKQMVADMAGAAAGAESSGSGSSSSSSGGLRPLQMSDFSFALGKTNKTGQAADEYAAAMHLEQAQSLRDAISLIVNNNGGGGGGKGKGAGADADA